MPKPSRLGGEAALYAAATLFALTSIAVKLAAERYPGIFVSASRFAIGALLCLAFILAGRRRLEPRLLPVVLFRGLFGSTSMIATYLAIGLTGPGRATLLSNTYPLFVSIFGWALFKERPAARTWLSLAVCSLGAVLVVRDGSGASLTGDLLALAGAVLAGVAVNFVRRASSGGADPVILYLAPCLFGLPLFAFAPLPAGLFGGAAGVASAAGLGAWAGPLLLLAVGGGAFLAQALMATGYRSVSAGKGSVVFYWETALTVLLGVLVAGERLNLRALAGLLVILGGLWLNRPAPAREQAAG